MLKPFRMCLAMLVGSSKVVSAVFRFLRRRIVFDELLDSNLDPPVVLDVTYSVRRRKVMPVALVLDLPRAFGGRISARSAALNGGGCGIAWIATNCVSWLSKRARPCSLTRLVSVKNFRNAHEIDGHTQLSIRLDIQRLLSS